MEETSALLASLVQTRSVQRALAPIAAQMSQLIIVNEAYEQGDTAAFPTDLVPAATRVKASTQALVKAAGHIAAQAQDETLCGEMPRACDLLSAAGDNLVTATQRMHMEQLSSASRRHMVRCAKDVLEATLKVMLVTDDGEVRRIVRSSQWVSERLGALTAVRAIKHLVPAFKSLTEAVMLFSNLVDKRRVELVSEAARASVTGHMTTLKKALPMLSSAMQTYVKYPSNAKAQSSKHFAVGQVIESVESIVAVIENKVIDDEVEEPEVPGHFVSTIDKVLDELSDDRRLLSAVVGSEFDLSLEAAVRHSMGVAHLSSQTHRQLIIKNCQRILRQRTQASDMAKSLQENPTLRELAEDFDDQCERLIEEFQDLERHVAASVTQLTVDVYKETTEPMERMIKAAVDTNSRCSDDELDAVIDGFQNHSDRMCQVARLVAAGADNARTVCAVRCCVSRLERLDPELVPAALACRAPGDKAALEQLRLLKHEWNAEVAALVTNLDALSDRQTLIRVSESEIKHCVSQCKSSMYAEVATVTNETRRLIGLSRRVAAVAKSIVDASDDPLYRNSLMVFINQLKKVVSAVKSAVVSVAENPGHSSAHDKLHRRCDVLMRCVTKLREAIEGKKSLDILHPSRINVRPAGAWQGLRVLEFNEDGDEEYTEDAFQEAGWDKENSPLAQSSEPRVKQEETQRKQALKSYVAAVTAASGLSELARSVASAAVAGRQQQLDLLCNDVLARTNHAAEQARALATCVPHADRKERLEEVVAEVNSLVPGILETTRRVCGCETGEIEAMHSVTEQWAKEVSYLESYVDSIILKWRPVADEMVDAAKMANTQLLRLQTEILTRHTKSICSLAALGRKCADPSDLLSSEHAQLMQEGADDLDNVTTLMITLADSVCKTGGDADKQTLELNGREWATRAYCVTTQLDNLANHSLQETCGRKLPEDRSDYTAVKAELRRFTDDTIRLKALAETARDSVVDTAGCRGDLPAVVCELDPLLVAMDDAATLLTGAALEEQHEVLLAPHRLALLSWQWCRQVSTVTVAMDELLREFSRPVAQLIVAAGVTHSDDHAHSPDAKAVDTAISEFQEMWSKSKTYLMEALEGSSNLDKKEVVRNGIEELNSLAEQIFKLIHFLHDHRGDRRAELELTGLRRRWAAGAGRTAAAVRQLGTENRHAVNASLRLLQGVPLLDKQPSAVLHSDSSPWWKKGDASGTAEKQGTTGAAAPRSGKFNKSSSNKSHNLTIHDLTGSLIDFADDLLAFDIDLEETCDLENSADDTLVDHKAAVLNISKSVNKNSAVASAGETASSDLSYKALSRTPRVAHNTPVKPSPHTSYKPVKKSSVANAGYQLPMEATQWEDENNAIVTVAKEMSQQLQDMADFTRQTGPILTRAKLISTAKDIAKNGGKLVSFTKMLAQYCVDKRCGADLDHYCNAVPTLIAQLNIVATVKATSDDDRASEKQLVTTAENLVLAINRMLSAAEAAAVRGFREVPVNAPIDASAALVLATTWKRRLERHRLIESHVAETDNLGLRKVDRNALRPTLSQIAVASHRKAAGH